MFKSVGEIRLSWMTISVRLARSSLVRRLGSSESPSDACTKNEVTIAEKRAICYRRKSAWNHYSGEWQLTKMSKVSKVPLQRSTSGLTIFSMVECRSGFQALELVPETSGIGFLEESVWETAVKSRRLMSHREKTTYPAPLVYHQCASIYLHRSDKV